MGLAARCADIPPGVEVSVAPCIVQTHFGWRIYTRMPDPDTGQSRKVPQRYPDDGRPVEQQLADLKLARDGAKLEARKLRQVLRQQQGPRPAASAEPGFTADADRYLAREEVMNMPAYPTREIEIRKWKELFGDRPRSAIRSTDINEQLHLLRKDYAGSTVNKFRTALMSLWTVLDGRSAANPVKDTDVFEERDLGARGQSYDLLERILAAIPDERGLHLDRRMFYDEVWRHPMTTVATRYDVSASFLARVCQELNVPRPPRGYWTTHPVGVLNRKRPPLPPAVGAKQAAGKQPQLLLARARLEVIARTGMEPLQLARCKPEHVSIAERWYTNPHRQKGARQRRTPRPIVRKPMSDEAVGAWQRFINQKAWGPSDPREQRALSHVLGKCWQRACDRVERELQKEYGDTTFRLPHIRVKDIRHSFGTAFWAHTKGNETAVGQMLDHAPGSPMTRKYAAGAVPSVLRGHMEKFHARKAARPKKARRGRKRSAA